MLPRWLVIALAILISIMWSANLIIGWQFPGRSEPSLNAIFAIVAGAVFALSAGPKASLQAGRRKIARMLDPQTGADETDDRGGQQ